MLRKQFIRNVSVYSRVTVTNIPPIFHRARMVYMSTLDTSKLSDYRATTVPESDDKIELYLSAHELYLSNFIADQQLLNYPVEAIALFDELVEIYIQEVKLCVPLDQLSSQFQTDKFLVNFLNPTSENNRREEPREKRRRISKESNYCDFSVPSSSKSQELGVRTFEEFSTLTCSSSLQNANLTDHSDSVPETQFSDRSIPDGAEAVLSPNYYDDEEDNESTAIASQFHNVSEDGTTLTSMDTSICGQIQKVLPRSALDMKRSRKLEVDFFSMAVKELMNKTEIEKKSIIVSTSHLALSRTFDDTDETMGRMMNELKDSLEIHQFDPIVVVKKDDEYHVVSGNRRVWAYKKCLVPKIPVFQIKTQEISAYRSIRFFRSLAEKEQQSNCFALAILEDLFTALKLPKSTAASWTNNQKREVFGSLFSSTTKIAEMMEIFLVDVLKNGVMSLSLKGIDCSTILLRDLTRKMRQNPGAIATVFQKEWDSEMELKKEVSKITPDIGFILKGKKIQQAVIDSLLVLFEDDPDFLSFVRKTDMRAIGKTTQLQFLKSKFQEYKKSLNVSDASKTHAKLKVSAINSGEFHVLLTSNESNARDLLLRTESLVVILLGPAFVEVPQCVLMLPDRLGVEDKHGRLNNHVSLSLLLKENGKTLDTSELSHHLATHGISNRTIFSVDQLKCLIEKFKSCFVDLGGFITTASTLLTPGIITVLVSPIYREQLEKAIRKFGAHPSKL